MKRIGTLFSTVLVGGLALAWAVAAVAQRPPPAAVAEQRDREVERELEAARERLERAAQDVAQLSAKMSDRVMQQMIPVDDLRKRAMLGVHIDDTPDKSGALVKEVSPGGPASEAGLQRGDRIVRLNGKSLAAEDAAHLELMRRMQEVKPGDVVQLGVMRDGKPLDLKVTTRAGQLAAYMMHLPPGAPVPPEAPLPPAFRGAERGWEFEFLTRGSGELAQLELATLTPKLGRYFGTDSGVLVVRAPPDSSYRLEDGDVIRSIGTRVPDSGTHALRILRSYQPGEKLTLRILRQRKPLTLDVQLPAVPAGRRQTRSESSQLPADRPVS
ncbi:MAG TPA: PDZ domain-containing protein [Steroidobacteraceae bacterium]|nr:PDZ domain-containing protein [Steroidobacteraceae bacterium]HRX88119.1 PDZ domain-containing protein [Steroidobacteraceae bacterium]